MLALRTLIFTLVFPGTVTVLVPWLILGGRAVGLPRPHMGTVGVLGCLLLVVGVAIYTCTAWEFAARGKGTPFPLDAPRQLVITGLYRWTRNPMYLGILSVVLGESLLFRSAALVIYAAVVCLGFNLFVRLYEEPTHRRRFGDAFDHYCATVPRWRLRQPQPPPPPGDG